jgi:protein-S-isoprenylcysteine O-methyltransferase Ste14
MTASGNDRPNTIHWPPLIYVAAGVAALGLDRTVAAWPLPQLPSLEFAGWGLAWLGLLVAMAGIVTFKQIGTVVDPTGQAVRLATTGVYWFTRNPMYLGVVLIFLGLGFATRSAGLLLVTPLVVIALQQLAIVREEAYLQRRFGSEYDAYRRSVRRWI